MRPATYHRAPIVPLSPRPKLTWEHLSALAPELRQYEAAGAQAAGNGWRGWFEWLRHHGDFQGLLRRLPEEAEPVVVEHLRRVHREALRGRK